MPNVEQEHFKESLEEQQWGGGGHSESWGGVLSDTIDGSIGTLARAQVSGRIVGSVGEMGTWLIGLSLTAAGFVMGMVLMALLVANHRTDFR